MKPFEQGNDWLKLWSENQKSLFQAFVEGKPPKHPTPRSQPGLLSAEPSSLAPELHGSHTNRVGAAGEISFPYAFPEPGSYRFWIQMKSQGRILTGVFDTTVAAKK